MKPVEPIHTVELFPELSVELLNLLKKLPRPAWDIETACSTWSVKDVVAHLLGGNLGRLSFGRDRLALHRQNAAPSNYTELVDYINQYNAEWVNVTRRISPGLLIEFLELTDPQLYQYFKSLPPFEPAGLAVAWAGDTQSPNWFDIAREYTEKWLHQQHIREAVNQPGLMARRWLFPVLDTFMRALPYTYRTRKAPEGTTISFIIVGEAGGKWFLLRQNDGWVLFSGLAPGAVCSVQLEQDLAWRLFTKGVSREVAQSHIRIEGDGAFGAEILNMMSIMA